MIKDNSYNLDIPLIGYAIGFPPVENERVGEYVTGNYDLDDQEEDYSDELTALPSDEDDFGSNI